MRASKLRLCVIPGTFALAVSVATLAAAATDADQKDQQVATEKTADSATAAAKSKDETCEEGKCPDGACKDPVKADAKVAVVKTDGKDDVVRPTHKQTTVINVNTADLKQTTVNSFCLTPEGNILAACGEETGEVRIFDKNGGYVDSFEVSVRPDAINVGSDGNIYIAGAGRLLKLDAKGKVLHEAESPHTAKLLGSKDELRTEIIEQQKQMGEQFSTQIEQYDKLIADLEKSQAEKEKAGKELTKSDKRRMESFVQMKKQYEDMAKQVGGKELTEEELDSKLKSSLEYKLRVASISEIGGDVYLACSASAGYGFNIWRLDRDFANGKVIVSDLRGCCGQMDVQASESGIYVAENARHRVCCYDREGKEIASWGKQARTGIDGFGSCCNPMNVAFGSDGSIYTAESEIGRVKRFSPKGELIDLVGKVDIVPGCKKVAIAVSKEGDNVFMLDVSRHQIVKMERLAPGEQIAYSERHGETAEAASGGSSLGSAVLRFLTGN